MEAFKINRKAIVGLEEFKNNLIKIKNGCEIYNIEKHFSGMLETFLDNLDNKFYNQYHIDEFNTLINESIILGLDLKLRYTPFTDTNNKNYLNFFIGARVIATLPYESDMPVSIALIIVRTKIILEAYIQIIEFINGDSDIFIIKLEKLLNEIFTHLISKDLNELVNSKNIYYIDEGFINILIGMETCKIFDIDYTKTILDMIIRGFGAYNLLGVLQLIKENKTDYTDMCNNVLREFTKYLTEVKDKRTIKDMTLPLGEPFHNDIEEDEEELGE